ncbi:hypothetical protein BH11MYX4_BH11MYX4_68870 [soil metagenome]
MPDSSLASSFAEGWQGSMDPAEAPSLDAALREHWARGRAAWPEVPLEARAFAAYVGERAPAQLAPVVAAGELRAADGFLACACTIGLPAAIRAFEASILSRLDVFLGPLRRPDVVDETRRQLLEQLFVAAPNRPATIARYGARCALASWVRVAALRVALSLVEGGREGEAFDADADADAVASSAYPELALVPSTERDEFTLAFRGAMAGLPRREQTILRFTHVERLAPARVGAIYGVAREDALRWIERAHEEVLAGTRTRLLARIDVSAMECESMMKLMRSDLHATPGARVGRE